MTGGTSRRQLLCATAGVATLTGCLGFDGEFTTVTDETTPADNTRTATEPTPSAERQIRFVVDGAPDGLQKFAFEISHTDGVSIAAIQPGVIDGEEFQVADGGVDESSALVRAADLSRTVGTFREERLLFTMVFEQEVQADELSVAAATVTADDGSAMTDDRWSIVAPGPTPTPTPTATPVPTPTRTPFDARAEAALLAVLNSERSRAVSRDPQLDELASRDAARMSELEALTPTGRDPSCDGAFQVLYQTWWQRDVDTESGVVYYDTPNALAEGVIDALRTNETYDYSPMFERFSSVGIGIERDETDRVWVVFWLC